MAPSALRSAQMLLFENGMAMGGEMEEEMGAGGGQGAVVQPGEVQGELSWFVYRG